MHIKIDNEPVRQPAPVAQRNKTASKPVSKPPVTKTNSNKQSSKPSQPEKKISPRQQPIQTPKGIGEYGDFSKNEASEEEVLGTIGKGHNAMSTVMSNRSKNLQIVRAMWTSGSTKVSCCRFCHQYEGSICDSRFVKCIKFKIVNILYTSKNKRLQNTAFLKGLYPRLLHQRISQN
ncbi:hypothetical protein KUTeg_019589 [Tegillarca granosa]|uniref:Uncharacterized protein n=1 Tax=Tegillarca granosa TaxID=220873 RepID=A0ABQ9EJ07_TEGGR|nr:hypothetical protein KUTeg_019589 [Tegillarca granosa]